MTLQPHNERFRQSVRRTYAFLGALIVAAAAPLAAASLVHSDDVAVRAVAVVLGVCGLLPYLWVIFAIVRGGDEFTRRIHLIAASIAFAASLVLLSLLAWLVEARFVLRPPLLLLWVVCTLLWAVAIIVVTRYFKRPL